MPKIGKILNYFEEKMGKISIGIYLLWESEYKLY